MPTVRLQTTSAGRYRDLARRLRVAADGGLQRDVVAELRRAGREPLRAVKAAVRAVDVQSSRGGVAPPDTATALRARTAGATSLHPLPDGISVRVDGRKVDPRYGPKLVRHLEGQRLRHPVFGHLDRWVGQRGEHWFHVTLRRHRPAFRRACERGMQKTIDRIRG